MSENPWKTLATRIVYADPWLRLREDTVVRPDGHEAIYAVVELRPSVGIVALNDADEVALVAQWRYTLGRMSVEIPTGASEASDPDMLAAAKRELREETGLTARSWRELGFVDNSNGSTTDIAHMFLAMGLEAGACTQDPEERIILSWMPFGHAVEKVLAGSITESVSVAAILKVEMLRSRSSGSRPGARQPVNRRAPLRSPLEYPPHPRKDGPQIAVVEDVRDDGESNYGATGRRNC